ncbi:MAG: sugar transferase [Ilumatobacteraceae bacterium]
MTRPVDAVRRVVDIGAAVGGMVVLSPIIAASVLAVRVRMGPHVIFRQKRLGLGGRPFEVLKLRTMLPAAPGRAGPEFDAERLTALGKWLRATSIDELPSLVNLLRGDITLVGPRPLPVHYWTRYRGDEYRRFEVKPGITGLAQISGRNTVGWPERLALDVRYVQQRSLFGDLRILFKTVPAVFARSGVDQASGVTMTELPADR